MYFTYISFIFYVYYMEIWHRASSPGQSRRGGRHGKPPPEVKLKTGSKI